MTATVVGGIAVVADEPTPSPYYKDRTGKPLLWTRTRTLTLADGSTIYGCAECDYASTNINAIRPHLNAHRTGPRRSRNSAPDIRCLSLAELLARVDQYDQVRVDRDAWRARAQAAERSLAVLREGAPVTPNPGSDQARSQGCICAVLDNNHGLYPAFGGGWWITAGCPVHAPEFGGPCPPQERVPS